MVSAARKTVKLVLQNRAQRKELARQTASIVGKLGRIGTLDGYVSIGDQGKMVLPLRAALGLRGEVWVLNDAFSDDTPAVLERGC